MDPNRNPRRAAPLPIERASPGRLTVSYCLDVPQRGDVNPHDVSRGIANTVAACLSQADEHYHPDGYRYKVEGYQTLPLYLNGSMSYVTTMVVALDIPAMAEESRMCVHLDDDDGEVRPPAPSGRPARRRPKGRPQGHAEPPPDGGGEDRPWYECVRPN